MRCQWHRKGRPDKGCSLFRGGRASADLQPNGLFLCAKHRTWSRIVPSCSSRVAQVSSATRRVPLSRRTRAARSRKRRAKIRASRNQTNRRTGSLVRGSAAEIYFAALRRARLSFSFGTRPNAYYSALSPENDNRLFPIVVEDNEFPRSAVYEESSSTATPMDIVDFDD